MGSEMCIRDSFAYFAAAAEHGYDSSQAEILEWASNCVSDLREHDPDRCLDWILVALGKASDDLEIGTLAAGPLEDLVVDHGDAVINRIEGLASASAEFRRLLSGIWSQGADDSEVWSRVVKAVGSGPYLDKDPRTPQGTAKRCLLYTSPSPRDLSTSRMPSSA